MIFAAPALLVALSAVITVLLVVCTIHLYGLFRAIYKEYKND